MESIGVVKIPMKEVMRSITCEVKLTGIDGWRIKRTVGIWLFKFGAWVMGMNCRITEEKRK